MSKVSNLAGQTARFAVPVPVLPNGRPLNFCNDVRSLSNDSRPREVQVVVFDHRRRTRQR